jgi:hypothetical protein
VFLSRGDGTFQPVQKLNPEGQYLTQVLAAGDFNKEGRAISSSMMQRALVFC